MKISSAIIVGFMACAFGLQAQTAGPSTSQVSVPVPTDYQVVQQDGNSRVWQRERYEEEPDGRIITNLDKYTELATGLNHLVGAQWVPSDESISILADGTGAATNGQHQVFFPGDILSGEIELVTADGKHLKSQPSALAYDDGSNTVLIAVLTNSIGQIVNDNEVIYTNAFDGLNADLLYTYTKVGFEQDVILREQPPTPESLGLNAATTRLQVLTEFFDPPQPNLSSNMLPKQAGLALSDDTLSFGDMQMVPGKAFMMGEISPSVSVGKSWLAVDGRQFLVEAVPVMAVAEELGNLPTLTTQAKMNRSIRVFSRKLALPQQHLVIGNSRPLKMAALDLGRKPGLLMDYLTVNSSLTNYTFQNDTTYYISGTINSYGTNTFEGGTIIKYASGASLDIQSHSGVSGPAVNFKSSAYLPVIFTAKDDNSVGDTISGSSGSPSGYYGTMLECSGISGTPTFSGFRISYAGIGVEYGVAGIDIYNAQFINCQIGINPNFSTVLLGNALFVNNLTNFNSFDGTPVINAQNVTIQGSTYLASGSVTVTLTNSILSDISNLTNGHSAVLTGCYNGFYSSPEFGGAVVTNIFYPFQTVGAGGYYLASGCSFTNAGTININSNVLGYIQAKTTYPPLVYSNAIISVNTTLYPQAQRDNVGTPSLGYHYDPLDYVFGGSDLYANLTLASGTAIGWFEHDGALNFSGQPYAVSINSGASITANGTTTAPCWIADYSTVQESANGNWVGSGYMGAFMLNGSGTGATPSINTTFAKWTLPWASLLIRDSGYPGEGTFADTEFYGGSFGTYDTTFLNFSNCMFYREAFYFFDSTAALTLTMQNCDLYNGFMTLNRSSGQNSSFWTIENTSIDGMGFSINDNYNGSSSYTLMNFNAYNTNNLSGLSFSYPYSPHPTNFLEVIGPNDLKVTNFNWQSSWFGNFYLPPTSPLINGGSTNANYFGLYHYTTQTNQIPETNSVVDIGYHYVATGINGLPLDSNGDGIPDYIEDANGNGLVDSGEIGWNLTNDLGLQVIISQPSSGSALP